MGLLLSKDECLIAYKDNRLQVWDLGSDTVECYYGATPIVRIDSNNLDATATLEDDGDLLTFAVCIEHDNEWNKLEEPIQFMVRVESIDELIELLKEVGIRVRTIYNELDGVKFKYEVPAENFVESNNKKNGKTLNKKGN